MKKKFYKHKIINSEDHINYKKYRNKVRIMIRDAQRKHTLKDCKKAKGNSGKMWKVIKKATNDNPTPSVTPNYVKTTTADGKAIKIKSKKEIANVMNRQFSEMGAKLAEKLNPTHASIFDYLKNPSEEVLTLSPTTESEVSKLIQELDVSKCSKIPSKIIKWADHVFTPISSPKYSTKAWLLAYILTV